MENNNELLEELDEIYNDALEIAQSFEDGYRTIESQSVITEADELLQDKYQDAEIKMNAFVDKIGDLISELVHGRP